MMGKLFGTNGIRGVFSDDFNLEFIHDITLSLATYFKNGPILIGYDGRDSSVIIAKTICSTLNFVGIDCNLAGLVPTPCLEYATKKLGYKGGIMITASHNPPQYNGIKPAASDGVEISREDEAKIEDIYFTKTWLDASGKWGTTGSDDRVISTYFEGIKSQVDVSAIKEKKFTVVLDVGNGAQAITAPDLCKELGCKTITINEKIDSTFPGRGSEPTPENLEKLSRAVQDSNADIGVAFDGDGDRSLFCDEKGKILTGDKSALLLTKFILENNPNSTVVTCLNSGSSIEHLAQQSNSKVVRTKVGSVEVSRKMVPINALIGFEENGGFMYGKHNQVRDGAMTLALVLDLLASTKKTISQKIEELPASFTTKDKIPCSPDDAKKIINTLETQNSQIDTSDGIKIIYDEKNWVMIRPSGTEPIIRIYAESESDENLNKLMSEHIAKIKSILSE